VTHVHRGHRCIASFCRSYTHLRSIRSRRPKLENQLNHEIQLSSQRFNCILSDSY